MSGSTLSTVLERFQAGRETERASSLEPHARGDFHSFAEGLVSLVHCSKSLFFLSCCYDSRVFWFWFCFLFRVTVMVMVMMMVMVMVFLLLLTLIQFQVIVATILLILGLVSATGSIRTGGATQPQPQ